MQRLNNYKKHVWVGKNLRCIYKRGADRVKGSKYITPEGARKLTEELQYLWKVERSNVTARVAAAAAQDDRSENAEYIYGKKRSLEIDSRICKYSSLDPNLRIQAKFNNCGEKTLTLKNIYVIPWPVN